MVDNDDTTKHASLLIWEAFLDVAEQWKQQHGVPYRGLLRSLPFSEQVPWKCASPEVRDPVDLLTEKLIGFEPYDQLEREHGRGAILAAICLAHAAGAPNTCFDRENTANKAKAALEAIRTHEFIEGSLVSIERAVPDLIAGVDAVVARTRSELRRPQRDAAKRTNERYAKARKFARKEAEELVAGDTEHELNKADMLRLIRDALKHAGHYVPKDDPNLWGWLTKDPSVIPPYMREPGARRKTT